MDTVTLIKLIIMVCWILLAYIFSITDRISKNGKKKASRKKTEEKTSTIMKYVFCLKSSDFLPSFYYYSNNYFHYFS